MSKIYEALTRGGDMLSEVALGELLEGQPTETVAAGPPPQAVPEAKPQWTAPVLSSAPVAQEHQGEFRSVPLRVTALSPVFPFDGTHWRAGEQYRMLRTRIAQHPMQPKMIVVTSAGPSDGKSVTAENLAGALALKNEARVLLLDGDFRRSSVTIQLGLPEAPGLADVLQDKCTLQEAIMQAQQVPNLFILPAGKTTVNPTELLDSARWVALCKICREEFDYIVIDSPPLGAVADYDLLQAASDGVVLVARPDHTDRQMCLKALKSVPKKKLIGVVLNCVQGWLMDKDRNHYSDYYYKPAGQD